ncbi:MAG: hypothetical protein WC494_01900 [Candidatus Pacearchaeota archaeon]
MTNKNIPNFKCCGEEECDCNDVVKVFFCPKCKSHNVRYIFGIWNLLGIIPRQKCFDCGFESNGFPILITTKGKIKEAEKSLKKKSKKLNKKVKPSLKAIHRR